MKDQIHHTIKSMVNSFLPNAQVLLFGSRARGESTIDSDYDLLVITRETYAPRVKMNWESKIRKALVNELNLPFDVIIQSEKEVSQKKNLSGHIVYYAMKEAVEI
ncbi:nucleotidyltransferase domain-containing protein [Hanamia caeni]|jgi:predicted nucleotidyltransferase|uniref:Nucleotidyltransferase domain-containing protein n=1 Tax=Hanamia caeni TaxID=2294116 RepID=A0A3M9NF99_9BACT|nr:nucleotidyltransferase domain-containing protein [Hanamia caeni]RNI36135.1 nucleotidyltransferase domain-containing protein [Hanamia caeni]